MDGDALAGLEVGYDIPARPGMALRDVATPCLLVDLDALDRNLAAMRAFCGRAGVALRAHGKMHKTPALALRQMERGGAVGICCQKVSEAEAFMRGGVRDVLISNEVRDPARLDRLAMLAGGPGRLSVCVDDARGVAELAAAVARHGTSLDVLVEVDCGQGRCGAAPGAAVVALARAIQDAPGLRFAGLQVYHGGAQHMEDIAARQAATGGAVAAASASVAALARAGIACATVTGAGTGSFPAEAASGVFTEIQCGSYAVMDAHYARVPPLPGAPAFEHALFVATTVISAARAGRAVVDAGLKAHAVDSGLPTVAGRPDLTYRSPSDEHGVIEDPANTLVAGDRLRLIPGHCDPTFNLHDWVVAMRGDTVEALWPVAARGKGY